jgi:hypothetical protein
MAQEFIFRFLSVRPAALDKKLKQAPTKTDLYPPIAGQTPFRTAIARASAAGAKDEVVRLVSEFRKSGRYVATLRDLKFDVASGLDWAQLHVDSKLLDPATAAGIDKLYGKPVNGVVGSVEYLDAVTRIADTLLAEALVRSRDASNVDRLVLAQKFLILLFEFANNVKFAPPTTVGDAIGSRTVIVPPEGELPQPQPPPNPPPPPPPPNPTGTDDATRQKLADYAQAHRELSDATVQPGALVQQHDAQTSEARITALEASLAACQAAHATKSAPELSGNAASLATGRLALAPNAVAGLSETTKRVLDQLGIDRAAVQPLTVVAALEHKISETGSQLASAQRQSTFIRLGGVELDKGKLQDAFGFASGGRPVPLPHTCDFQAGVGDLLMVKQKLKAYELAEFSYVENVLAGETRDREHRRLDQSEQITTTEQTTETDKEKDLQTTLRNEMQTEASKTVKDQFGLEAGLQVSGSYGPVVQFAAHLNANYSTTSEETQRKTVAFSQEVTQKTSERVTQTVKQTVSQRVLQEIQEINKHAFTNTSASKHIRGIYRWLNKVYDAQIFNYGQRMMYEFVVPEPAAYFLYAMIQNPPGDDEIVKPEPPTLFGQPLTPTQLTRTNYYDFVAKYQVHGAPPPPPQFRHAAYFDKQDNVDNGSTFGRAAKIDVQDGYVAFGAAVSSDWVFSTDKNHVFHVMLGSRAYDQTSFWGTGYQDIDLRYNELSVAYKLHNAWAFTLGVDVACRLTDVGFAKWQHQMYDAIIEAYVRLKTDYDDKKAAQAIQQDPGVLGRNPAENTRITKEELKKLVLMMLTGSDDIALDSYYASDEPLMDLDKACQNGARIRFFENAFEWTNMLWVLYPYFWGRHARWISAIHLKDPDADFAAFLRAGAARVQVPVRPGFEKAVVHFCQFGEIWNGNDPPLRDDDLYVPIVDEIAANLGKFDNDGVPYPANSKPWEVRVPTELVLLQNLSEVPSIVDMMTGQKITVDG